MSLHPSLELRRRAVLRLVPCVVVVAIAGLAGISLDAGPASPAAPVRARSPGAGSVYVVQPGDTLWSIARSLTSDDGEEGDRSDGRDDSDDSDDVRPTVDRLAALNGGATLEVGQRLVLP